uniref:Uncharacterized protein n=1 Tax=Opuntia streptacantha TaxID=393608 RepID=A0A7C8Z373_OPUST
MWYACSSFGFKCFSAQFVMKWPLNSYHDTYIIFGLAMDLDMYTLKMLVSPLFLLGWMRWYPESMVSFYLDSIKLHNKIAYALRYAALNMYTWRLDVFICLSPRWY